MQVTQAVGRPVPAPGRLSGHPRYHGKGPFLFKEVAAPGCSGRGPHLRLQLGPHSCLCQVAQKSRRSAKQGRHQTACPEKKFKTRAVGPPAARNPMMPKTRGVLSHPSKAARKLARQALGPLSLRVVSPNALKRYKAALDWFFFWARATNRSIPATSFELDGLVAEAIETGWQEGESRGLMGDLLSALPHFFTGLRNKLPSGWRLWSAWGKLELPLRAWPLRQEQLYACCHAVWQWGFADCAILMWTAFEGLLRTAEVLSLCAKQLHFKRDLRSVFISLPNTKGSARKGAAEGVLIEEPVLTKLLAKAVANLLPGDKLLRRSQPQFRIVFDAAIKECGLDGHFKPYSLRRGGATHWFRTTGSLDTTTDRGRWGCVKTARIYINTGLAEMNEQLQSTSCVQKVTSFSCAWRSTAAAVSRG